MAIWLYCIFSNNSEILPFFLRHYAPQVDKLILFDNCSTDNSRALIAAYPNAEVRAYPAERPILDSLNAAQFASTQYHEARGYADWVIWVDCDEFLWSSARSWREALRAQRAQGVRAIRSCGYQMLARTFPTGDAPITDQVRYGIRDSEWDKVAAFDPNLNIRFRPGRHNCRIDGVEAQQGEVKLLHYRYLGLDYFQRRNVYSAANRSPAEVQANRSYHVVANHQGKYSAAWFQNAMLHMSDVVTTECMGVIT